MTAHRWPVFVWREAQEFWCARLLSDQVDAAGAGVTADLAVEAVEAVAKLAIRRGEWDGDDPPDAEPEVIDIAVMVRPEYRTQERTWAVRDAIRLLIPVAVMTGDGGRIAYLPTLSRIVHLNTGDHLKDRVGERVKLVFSGDDPGIIAAHRTPTEWHLATVKLEARRRRPVVDRTRPDALTRVAESITGTNARAWQREALVAQVAARLGRGSLVLLGEPGCGKTAVLHAAVRQAERQHRQQPEDQDDADDTPRFWATSAHRLIAGMRWLGQWQERLEAVIHRLAAIDGTLLIDRLSDLAAVGGHDELDSVAAFLAPYLRRGDLRLVGEGTALELDALRRRLPLFADAFAVITVPPLTNDQAVAVVRQACEAEGRRHGLAVDPPVPVEIADLFQRHLGDAGMPGPAVRFAARMIEQRARAAGSTDGATITRGDVTTAFTAYSGLPERLLNDRVPLTADQLHAELAHRIIGQSSAVSAACDVILRVKSGLIDPLRPLATLLFAGPTGVGKTALARSLADTLFSGLGPGRALIRLDLSEYAGGDAPERLLGSGAEPSELIRRLRQQPSAVVLLDEIEKAHPIVFDLLLGALDEGRLGDALGRRTSLRSTVIIATSNLGADARPIAGFADPTGTIARHQAIGAALATHFRPEFLARLDRVVVFNALTRDDVRQIAAIELAALADREGLSRRGMILTWDDALLDALADRGFDPAYGARPLQRVLQTLVAAPLARWLMESAAKPGAAIRLGWDGTATAIG